MLKFSYSESPKGQRWILCGRLAGPWVEELRAFWRQVRERAPLAHAVVDLKDVLFIDEAGERLLAEMGTSGADLVAAGVENKHLIATLKNGAGHPLRRGLEDLCSGRPATAEVKEKER